MVVRQVMLEQVLLVVLEVVQDMMVLLVQAVQPEQQDKVFEEHIMVLVVKPAVAEAVVQVEYQLEKVKLVLLAVTVVLD